MMEDVRKERRANIGGFLWDQQSTANPRHRHCRRANNPFFHSKPNGGRATRAQTSRASYVDDGRCAKRTESKQRRVLAGSTINREPESCVRLKKSRGANECKGFACLRGTTNPNSCSAEEEVGRKRFRQVCAGEAAGTSSCLAN